MKKLVSNLENLADLTSTALSILIYYYLEFSLAASKRFALTLLDFYNKFFITNNNTRVKHSGQCISTVKQKYKICSTTVQNIRHKHV